MSSSEKIKIYFLSSGPIGIPILKALQEAPRLELVGVGTQEKRPKTINGHSRGSHTAIAAYCDANGIAVERYATVNSEEFLAHLSATGAQLLVVASFGQILKAPLLELLPFKCLNVHASILPRYRGASPVVSAMLNGEAEAGVSFMQMDIGLDTGGVYATYTLPILPTDSASSLELHLGELAGERIEEVICQIVEQGLQPVPQDDSQATLCGKIKKEDGIINWQKSAEELCRMVRAYFPWPSARALIPCRNGMKNIKLVEATVVEYDITGTQPGELLSYGREGIIVACGQNALKILRLIPEGKNEMGAGDYLRGNPIPEGKLCMG